MKRQFLFITLSLAFSSMFANDIEISFAAKGASTTVGSVKVENLTKGTSITLNGTDVLVLTSTTSVEDITKNEYIQVVPNPVKNDGKIIFNAPISGIANISIVNEAGAIVALQADNLQSGSYIYTVNGLPSGIFFVTVSGNGYSLHARLISTGTTSNTISLKQTNGESKPITVESKLKSLKSLVQMSYSSGDNLKFTGTTGTLTATLTDIPTANKTITFSFAIYATDYDGNSYKTVTIGYQTWFAENLKNTKYNDGTAIPNVSDNTVWSTLTTGALCTYNNITNTDTIKQYGRLYNWYAVNTGKLCPTGWHVPNDAEWTFLECYLIANGYNYDSSITGNKIAKSMASTTGWGSKSSTIGNMGNNPSTNNKSGFTALPGGYRYGYGSVGSFGYIGEWWSSSENGSSSACSRALYGSGSNLEHLSGANKVSGLSVRCLMDEQTTGIVVPSVTTQTITKITQNTAMGLVNITSNGGASIIAQGICWSTSHNPTIADKNNETSVGFANFNISISELTAGTTYYVRAYATNSVGTSYGNEQTFITTY